MVGCRVGCRVGFSPPPPPILPTSDGIGLPVPVRLADWWGWWEWWSWWAEAHPTPPYAHLTAHSTVRYGLLNRQKYLNRHSRAGGNPDLSARKLMGKNGFFRFDVLDSHFRGNDAEKFSCRFEPVGMARE